MIRFTVLLFAIALATLAHAQDKLTYPYPGAPDYCYWLSGDQCAKAKEIVSTGKKPSWCGQDWALAGSGLTPEQHRTCWHYSQIEDANDPQVKAAEQRQQQVVADAIAAVKSSWRTELNTIRSVVVAYKCNLIDSTLVNADVYRLQWRMAEIARRHGVNTGPGLDIKAATDAAVNAAGDLVKGGVCDNLTPELRGKMRKLASDLNH